MHIFDGCIERRVVALARFQTDSFRTESQCDCLALCMMTEFFGHLDRAAIKIDAVLSRFVDRCFEHVECADEGRNKARGRTVIDIKRSADLICPTFMHDDDTVGDRQCFFLIMCHEDSRDAQLLLDRTDFLTQ